MRVLADVWRQAGGNVLGLAPSAVAARELGVALRREADTLAKLTADLTTSLATGSLPEWLQAVGPNTLVVVDEAGMAATTDLATLVRFAIGRGASVRLVGDDQQLASVAAGGVLRDLVRETPSASLSVVHRFADPGEAAATLAIRAGDPTALGYYTDHQRIHVGGVGSATDRAYRAWQADRSAGLDSLLLAPTRAVTTELNERARADRLAGAAPGRALALADGTQASTGDVVVTRHNDRRRVVCDTDWVKNGDRWQVTRVHRDGSLSVARLGNRRHGVLLPAEYVAEHVQLGYAATVHSAQGMTVDTSHTVLDGAESRQLLYVAVSRGRLQNHVYLGDTAAQLDSTGLPQPATPLETLQSILNRDLAQQSATTAQLEARNPASRLHDAVLRYQDGIALAAEYGLMDTHEERHGPLPWLPAIPKRLEDHATWGRSLRERSELVTSLADRVALEALTGRDPWSDGLNPHLTAEIAVWRAAYGVPENEPRPTGPRVDGQGWDHQRFLDRQVAELPETASTDWSPSLPPVVLDDRAVGQLRRRLDELGQRRPDVPVLIHKAFNDARPLPVENPADALWWRIVAADASTPGPVPKRRIPLLPAMTQTSHHGEDYSYSPRPDRSPGIGR